MNSQSNHGYRHSYRRPLYRRLILVTLALGILVLVALNANSLLLLVLSRPVTDPELEGEIGSIESWSALNLLTYDLDPSPVAGRVRRSDPTIPCDVWRGYYRGSRVLAAEAKFSLSGRLECWTCWLPNGRVWFQETDIPLEGAGVVRVLPPWQHGARDQSVTATTQLAGVSFAAMVPDDAEITFQDRGQPFRGCDLTGASFENLNLAGIDFTHAILDLVHFHRADLSQTMGLTPEQLCFAWLDEASHPVWWPRVEWLRSDRVADTAHVAEQKPVSSFEQLALTTFGFDDWPKPQPLTRLGLALPSTTLFELLSVVNSALGENPQSRFRSLHKFQHPARLKYSSELWYPSTQELLLLTVSVCTDLPKTMRRPFWFDLSTEEVALSRCHEFGEIAFSHQQERVQVIHFCRDNISIRLEATFPASTADLRIVAKAFDRRILDTTRVSIDALPESLPRPAELTVSIRQLSRSQRVQEQRRLKIGWIDPLNGFTTPDDALHHFLGFYVDAPHLFLDLEPKLLRPGTTEQATIHFHTDRLLQGRATLDIRVSP